MGDGTDMKLARWAVAGVIALALAGCSAHTAAPGVATAAGSGGGGGGGGASAAASPSASPATDSDYKFIQCMHDQGIDIPQPPPTIDGVSVSSIAVPDPQHGGPDPAKLAAAEKKCQQYMPASAYLTSVTPQEMQALLDFSRCMRANGFTQFPDPDKFGGTAYHMSWLKDPVFIKAHTICSARETQATAAPSGGSAPSQGSN